MVSNPVWLKSIRRAADSNPRTSIRKASVLTTRPEGILIFVTYLQKVRVASLADDFAKNIFLNESKK